ncbi:MAG: GNAT family N-acetyltransferase [Sphingobacteriales bacterium]|nr:MAG: GNAT family N-acetyltransferase [Sphingobacteriales bacterium]
MLIYAETERLILRELLPSDAQSIFELDSDPEVHRYLGGGLAQNIGQSRQYIDEIRRDYLTKGIGRWAVIEKTSLCFAGWAGLKLETKTVNLHTHFYDLGFRLATSFWGKGYATEAAIAALNQGFEKLNISEIFADADHNNVRSKRVLEKAGLKLIESFDDEGYKVDWYKITKQEWQTRNPWHI